MTEDTLRGDERYDYERLKRLEIQGLDAYQKMEKAKVGSPERMVAYINQLSPWNLERGAEALQALLASYADKRVRESERQARANALAEAADLVTGYPEIYKELMTRREQLTNPKEAP